MFCTPDTASTTRSILRLCTTNHLRYYCSHFQARTNSGFATADVVDALCFASSMSGFSTAGVPLVSTSLAEFRALFVLSLLLLRTLAVVPKHPQLMTSIYF